MTGRLRHPLAGGADARPPHPAGQAVHEPVAVPVDVGEDAVEAHGVLGSSHRLVMSGLLSHGVKVQFLTRADQKKASRS